MSETKVKIDGYTFHLTEIDPVDQLLIEMQLNKWAATQNFDHGVLAMALMVKTSVKNILTPGDAPLLIHRDASGEPTLQTIEMIHALPREMLRKFFCVSYARMKNPNVKRIIDLDGSLLEGVEFLRDYSQFN